MSLALVLIIVSELSNSSIFFESDLSCLGCFCMSSLSVSLLIERTRFSPSFDCINRTLTEPSSPLLFLISDSELELSI